MNKFYDLARGKYVYYNVIYCFIVVFECAKISLHVFDYIVHSLYIMDFRESVVAYTIFKVNISVVFLTSESDALIFVENANLDDAEVVQANPVKLRDGESLNRSKQTCLPGSVDAVHKRVVIEELDANAEGSVQFADESSGDLHSCSSRAVRVVIGQFVFPEVARGQLIVCD